MTANTTPAIERIARVIAGERLSAKAEGVSPSAGPEIDARWPEFRGEAIAILKSLREAPAEIAQYIDGEAWTRAIAAALGESPDSGMTSGLDEVAESARHFLRAPS